MTVSYHCLLAPISIQKTSSNTPKTKMAEIDVKASKWKQVEVGRIVLFIDGAYKGRLAAIVEIIDHKRVRASACLLRGGI